MSRLIRVVPEEVLLFLALAALFISGAPYCPSGGATGTLRRVK
jgi:hypothetical protein